MQRLVDIGREGHAFAGAAAGRDEGRSRVARSPGLARACFEGKKGIYIYMYICVYGKDSIGVLEKKIETITL